MSLVDLSVVVTTLIYVVVGGGIGIRLLLLARRTRGFPELALGIGEILLAGLVPPIFTVIQLASDETVLRTAFFLGHLVYWIGCAVMIAFTWQVFRPRHLWARWTACGMMGSIAVAGVVAMARTFTADLAGLREPQRAAFVYIEWVSLLGFAWTAVEAFALHAKLRKQVALGIGDPVVANRVLLWGWVGLSGVLAAGAPVAATFFGLSTMTHAPTRLLCALGTLVSSICIQLAFLPPQRYLRWVRSAQGTRQETSEA